MLRRREVGQPQRVSGAFAVGEKFSQCGATASPGVFIVDCAVMIRDQTPVQCSSRLKLAWLGIEPRIPGFCSAILSSMWSELQCADTFSYRSALPSFLLSRSKMGFVGGA
uniref:Uncharacterized protein n=1 Tax=Ixodes ricinus TaxID=34613 RepID=A0A6B0UIU3_IXORI